MKKVLMIVLAMLICAVTVMAADVTIIEPSQDEVLQGTIDVTYGVDNANLTKCKLDTEDIDDQLPVDAEDPFEIKVLQDIEFILTVFCYNESDMAINASASKTLTVNNPPVANAGVDQKVDVGDLVTLNGSKSTDVKSYSWVQTDGPVVTLTGANTATPSFTPEENDEYKFTLNVTDDFGATDTDSVDITVGPGLKLQITDLDVEVGSNNDKNIENEEDDYLIREEAAPGDTVEFKLKIENLYTRDEDIDIEDVEVLITIKDIDDGDDLEEESDTFDIRRDDDEKVTLTFEIPMMVDEDEYDVVIEITGEDEDGYTHEIIKNLRLEVKKERHQIMIEDSTRLTPSQISCDRTTRLDVDILNLGRDEEDEVVIEITNTALGIDVRETDIDLDYGNDEDAEYSKSVNINVDDKLKAGSYDIRIQTYYDTTKQEEGKTLTLIVKDCVEEEVIPEKKEEEKAVEVVVKPKDEITPPTNIVEAKPVSQLSTWMVTLIVVVAIIIVGLIIFGIGAAIIKSKK